MIVESSWFASASVLRREGHLHEALAAYERVLQAVPAHGEALAGLCQVLEALGRSEEAVPFLDRALRVEIEPQGHSQLNVAWRHFELGRVDEALTVYRRLASEVRPELALASIALIIPGSPRSGNQAILDARRAWAERYLPKSFGSAGGARRRASGVPIRVGYVSSFFQNENWMKPVWGLINAHDRRSFQIHLFSDSPASEIQSGYRWNPEDCFHDISSLSNEEVAEQIELLEIDVLVDLNGYSRMQRLPLFALRPAPVIAGWFNMYATTGMSCFDYLIGDAVVISDDEERFYCERILRVPGSYLTFEVAYPVPEVTTAPCSNQNQFTFGCLAPLYKITEETVAAWSRILHGAPRSRLILRNSAFGSAENVKFVDELFREIHISPDRYHLLGPAGHYEFLRTYERIDVALDTFPYSGGNTTIEAIWQGVPVLTFHGDRWVSRTSASILHAANLGQFVGRTIEAYVSMAISMANSADTPEFLRELRQNMRPRLLQAPVCDTAAFALEMEGIYRRIVNHRQEGQGN